MTKSLSRRIERLEEMIVPRHGPRLICITNVVEEEGLEEGPGLVKLPSSLWAYVFGAPPTADKITTWKEEYNQERNAPDGVFVQCGGASALVTGERNKLPDSSQSQFSNLMPRISQAKTQRQQIKIEQDERGKVDQERYQQRPLNILPR